MCKKNVKQSYQSFYMREYLNTISIFKRGQKFLEISCVCGVKNLRLDSEWLIHTEY